MTCNSAVTITLGDSDNDGLANTSADAVYIQADSDSLISQDGKITSWTYSNANNTSASVMLELLSGSGNNWTMRGSVGTRHDYRDEYICCFHLGAGWMAIRFIFRIGRYQI